MPNKQSATKVLKNMGTLKRRNSFKKQDQTRSNNSKSHGKPSGNGNKKNGDQTNNNNAATLADSPLAPNKENMDENVIIQNDVIIQNEKLQEEKLKLLGEEIDEESNFDELEFEALWQKEVVGMAKTKYTK